MNLLVIVEPDRPPALFWETLREVYQEQNYLLVAVSKGETNRELINFAVANKLTSRHYHTSADLTHWKYFPEDYRKITVDSTGVIVVERVPGYKGPVVIGTPVVPVVVEKPLKRDVVQWEKSEQLS